MEKAMKTAKWKQSRSGFEIG